MSYFAIIVGAGPAGLLCALHLHKLRPDLASRLLILEKKSHPRKKLCGGGVNRKAFGVLREAGIDFEREAPAHFNAGGYDIRFRDKRHVVEKPGGTLIFDRAVLDSWLCERVRAAGIEVRENEALESYEVSRDGVVVTTEKGSYEAQAIVACDGVGSKVRKLAGFEDEFPRARLIQGERPLNAGDENYLVFDFSCMDHGIQGYTWLFPEPDPADKTGKKLVAKIGLYDRTPHASRRVNPRPLLCEIARGYGYEFAESDFESWAIREWTPRSEFARPRVLLAGDAAGADPLVAEGLHQAFAYGRHAAHALAAAQVARDYSFKHYTRDIRRGELGAELARNRLGASLLYTPAYEYMLRAGFKLPGILERVFAYVAGEAPELSGLQPRDVVAKTLWHTARRIMPPLRLLDP